MNKNKFIPVKSRKLHSLPHLNNYKFSSYTMPEIRRTIEHDVCEHFDVPIEKIWSKSRKREYVFARHTIMTLMVHYTTYSCSQIVGFYNRADHATVLHARDTIMDFLDPRIDTPEKYILNKFFYQHGYKAVEKQVQKERAFVIDAHY